LTDDDRVAVRVDDPELTGAHVERVLDGTDGQTGGRELVVQRPKVRRPAVEQDDLRIDPGAVARPVLRAVRP
jgi:hypothetical protein